MKKISVLGSTGSVGTQALEVIRQLKDFDVIALSAGKNIDLIESQIKEFNPKYVCVSDEKDALALSKKFKNIEFMNGVNGLCKISGLKTADIVFNSVSGFTGIYVSFSAIKSGKNLALANKESIVAGGKFLMDLSRTYGCNILPVDSEHSAVWQCLDGKEKFVNKLILTASGGPFFGLDKEQLGKVSIEQVLNHPTWHMGAKISVDSATMMNKGFEIIEASHLFNILPSQIDVVIHPQSIIHSMVEFCDGNIFSQMSIPSMKFPIQYALTYPTRKAYNQGNLNLCEISNLSFFSPSKETQSLLNMCKDTVNDNSLSCALNAINEEIVNAFLQKKVSFLDMETLIKRAMDKVVTCKINSLDDLEYCDQHAREIARSCF